MSGIRTKIRRTMEHIMEELSIYSTSVVWNNGTIAYNINFVFNLQLSATIVQNLSCYEQ